MVESHILAASAVNAALLAVTLFLPGHLAPHNRPSLDTTKNYFIGQPPWVSIFSSAIILPSALIVRSEISIIRNPGF